MTYWDEFVQYPFPLADGLIARFDLPRAGLTAEDVTRLKAWLDTLVIAPDSVRQEPIR